MHHENGDLGMPQHAFGGTAENALAQAAVAVGAHHQAFRPGAAGLVEQALRDALAARRVGPGLGVDAMAGEVAGEAARLDRVIALTLGDQPHLLCPLQQRQSGPGSDRGLAIAGPVTRSLSADALPAFRPTPQT